MFHIIPITAIRISLQINSCELSPTGCWLCSPGRPNIFQPFNTLRCFSALASPSKPANTLQCITVSGLAFCLFKGCKQKKEGATLCFRFIGGFAYLTLFDRRFKAQVHYVIRSVPAACCYRQVFDRLKLSRV